MKTVGVFEAKTHLSGLLDEVERGEAITITRHGRAVARLLPVGAVSRARLEDAVARLQTFRAGRRLDGLSLKGLIDEGRR